MRKLEYTQSNRFAIASGAVLLSVSLVAWGQPAPSPTELVLGPIELPYTVQGVTINSKVTSYLEMSTSPAGLSVKTRTFVDLRDLQAKIGSIIDTQPLPRDNCRSYSGNNPVVTIHTKKLALNGDAAVLTVSGDVDMWDCRANPIPNSKVVWVDEKVLGINIRRPKVETWPGSPIKNILLQQPVTATLGARLAIPSPNTVAVVMLQPDVQLGGQPALAAARDFLLGLFRVDINAMADKALRAAIDPAMLKVALPPEIAQMNLALTKAAFVDVGGLGVEVNAGGVVPAAGLTELIQGLTKKP